MQHSIEEIVLKNGAKGILVDIPTATVMTFDISFRAGEYLVERDKWETPHLMEHLLLGANQKYRNARSFYAEFEKNGAYNNASTDPYHITYEAECADFEWQRILDLTLLAITKPMFLATEFEAEKGNVKEELISRGNNHFRHLSLAMRKNYGLLAMLDQEREILMNNVTLDDIRKHYKATHTTSNMRFIIAGRVQQRREEIIEALEATELPLGSGRIALPLEIPKGFKKTLYVPNRSVKNIYFYLDTFHVGKLSDQEQDALMLLNVLLTETMHSLIFGEAREKGLVYGMGSGSANAEHYHSFWLGAQVQKENSNALLGIVHKEFKKILNGTIDDESIVAAQQFSLGRFQRSAQTVGGVSNGYSNRYFYEDIIDDYYMIPERIKAVNKDLIISSTKKLFENNVWGFGVLGTFSKERREELRSIIADLWG